MSRLCFYCQGAEPLPHERFCTSCRKELLTNKGKYLKRLIVDAEERMADFKVLSKDAAKYRISKKNAMSNEYAMKRFGELVQTMKDRIGILSKELQVGDEGRD